MALFNHATKEVTAKLVYYGPGLCGKTTNLQWIHDNMTFKSKGKLVSLATQSDRTLFFDFLPVELGTIRGMRTRMQIYTVPGQVFYEATRRMVLKGCDAVVFVADSQAAMLDANAESQRSLRQNLLVNEIDPLIPQVIQYNKRDTATALPLSVLNERLNPRNLPHFEAVAFKGTGVEATLKGVTKLLFQWLSRYYGEGAGDVASASAGTAARDAPAEAPERVMIRVSHATLPTDASRPPGAATTPPAAAPARPPAPAAPPPAARPAAPAVPEAEDEIAPTIRFARQPPPTAPTRPPTSPPATPPAVVPPTRVAQPVAVAPPAPVAPPPKPTPVVPPPAVVAAPPAAPTPQARVVPPTPVASAAAAPPAAPPARPSAAAVPQDDGVASTIVFAKQPPKPAAPARPPEAEVLFIEEDDEPASTIVFAKSSQPAPPATPPPPVTPVAVPPAAPPAAKLEPAVLKTQPVVAPGGAPKTASPASLPPGMSAPAPVAKPEARPEPKKPVVESKPAVEGKPAARAPEKPQLPSDPPPRGEGLRSDQWLYLLDGAQRGPIDVEDLIDLVLTSIPENTKVWHTGLEGWVLANQVRQIADEIPPPIPVPGLSHSVYGDEEMPDFNTVPPMLRSVLIADEDAAFRKYLAMPLAAQGFTIFEAADGSAAWQLAVQNRPWMILADISMPELDGFEFCRRVRNHPMLSRLPLLFISGSDKYKERYRALQIGADDFLSKSMPVRELLMRIQLLMTRYSDLAASEPKAGTEDVAGAFQGRIEVFGAPALLQMCAQGRLTGLFTSLAEDSQNTATVMGLRGGDIIAATVGATSGVDAVYAFLAWTKGSFKFTPGDPGDGEPLAQSVEHLLLEGCRLLDEANKGGPEDGAAFA